MVKKAGWFLGIAALVAIAFFAYRKIGGLFDDRMATWKAELKAAAETTAARAVRSAKADTVYVTVRSAYLTARTRALGSPTATAHDTAAFAKCDDVVSACDSLRAADASEKAGLREELRIARNKPSEKSRRWILYGEALYGITGVGPDSVLGAAPVVRAGSEFRLWFDITVKVEGELSVPPAGRSMPVGRALVGIRYVF